MSLSSIEGATTALAHPLRTALIPSSTIVLPDLPVSGRIQLAAEPSSAVAGSVVRLAERLTFDTVDEALERGEIAGVVVTSPVIPDHARKMLQESGIAVAICESAHDRLTPGSMVQLDAGGVVALDELAVPVTAICSTFTDQNELLYKSYNVRDIGYFRFKFSLFQLYVKEPTAFGSPEAIEEHLTERASKLVARGWRSVRFVLSDPTSAELLEVGVKIDGEGNPELGVRGPRVAHRWLPELKAVRNVHDRHPDVRLSVSAPFVSSLAEYAAVVELVSAAGLQDRVGVGLTFEVPALKYELPQLFDKFTPSFMAVGTSDLFALLNGVDRSHPKLKIDPHSVANRRFLEELCAVCRDHDVDFFVCGEVRKDPALARTLVEAGCAELIASSSAREIASMNRVAAG